MVAKINIDTFVRPEDKEEAVVELGSISEPAVIVDLYGRILAWVLIDVINQQLVVCPSVLFPLFLTDFPYFTRMRLIKQP